jgi:hypothetical protein
MYNTPGVVRGISYTGHAFSQMAGRGIPPSAVEYAMESGDRITLWAQGIELFLTEELTVVTNMNLRHIVTVY